MYHERNAGPTAKTIASFNFTAWRPKAGAMVELPNTEVKHKIFMSTVSFRWGLSKLLHGWPIHNKHTAQTKQQAHRHIAEWVRTIRLALKRNRFPYVGCQHACIYQPTTAWHRPVTSTYHAYLGFLHSTVQSRQVFTHWVTDLVVFRQPASLPAFIRL